MGRRANPETAERRRVKQMEDARARRRVKQMEDARARRQAKSAARATPAAPGSAADAVAVTCLVNAPARTTTAAPGPPRRVTVVVEELEGRAPRPVSSAPRPRRRIPWVTQDDGKTIISVTPLVSAPLLRAPFPSSYSPVTTAPAALTLSRRNAPRSTPRPINTGLRRLSLGG